MSNTSRGASRERQVAKLLEGEGWAVTRGAGSHGEADLWAGMAKDVGELGPWVLCELRLIQVKTDKRGPYNNFSPKDRRELAALAAQTGGIAELCWWPANRDPHWIKENEWP